MYAIMWKLTNANPPAPKTEQLLAGSLTRESSLTSPLWPRFHSLLQTRSEETDCIWGEKITVATRSHTMDGCNDGSCSPGLINVSLPLVNLVTDAVFLPPNGRKRVRNEE